MSLLRIKSNIINLKKEIKILKKTAISKIKKEFKFKDIKMKYNKIIIYGGTSEISLSLIDMYINECEKLIVFCRSKKKFVNYKKMLEISNSENLKKFNYLKLN